MLQFLIIHKVEDRHGDHLMDLEKEEDLMGQGAEGLDVEVVVVVVLDRIGDEAGGIRIAEEDVAVVDGMDSMEVMLGTEMDRREVLVVIGIEIVVGGGRK